MYESPITTMITEIQDNVAKRFTEQTENMVYQEVRNIGVYIDKEELLKALKYDRNQYEKGYADAMKDINGEIEKAIQDSKNVFDFERVNGLMQAWNIIYSHTNGKE